MHRKQTTALIIASLFILGIGLNACSPGSSQEPGRYFEKSKGFSIKFPSDWEKIKTTKGIKAIGPKDDSSGYAFGSIAIHVMKTNKIWNLEGAYEQNLDTAENLPSFELLEKGQSIIDNVDAKWILYSCNIEPLQPEGYIYTIKPAPLYKTMFYIFVKGRKIYAITCVSTPDKFTEYRNTFEQIIQSFRFE